MSLLLKSFTANQLVIMGMLFIVWTIQRTAPDSTSSASCSTESCTDCNRLVKVLDHLTSNCKEPELPQQV